MGQLEGAGKNGGKKGKNGIFLQFLGSVGIRWEKEEGICSWDFSVGGNSCPAAQTGGGSTSRWKTEENPADVEETHGRAGNPTGTGLIYWEKGKFGIKWCLPPRLVKIHRLHPSEWE